MLASLTLILGRARSSLSLVLCSVRRLSLSSAIDCLCGRAGAGAIVMEWGEEREGRDATLLYSTLVAVEIEES